MVERILGMGLDVNEELLDGVNSLHHAAWFGHVEILRLLIRNGSDVNLRSSEGMRPLELAIKRQHIDFVKALIGAGADTTGLQECRCIQNSGVKASIRFEHFGRSVFRLFFVDGDMIPLHYAVLTESSELVSLLLDNGADIEEAGELGASPLVYAAQNHCAKSCWMLLNRGAKADATDEYGISVRWSYPHLRIWNS